MGRAVGGRACEFVSGIGKGRKRGEDSVSVTDNCKMYRDPFRTIIL